MSTAPNPAYGTSGYGFGGYGNSPIECLPTGYYAGLLTHQYRLSPKLNALLYLLLKKFDNVSQCLVSMDVAFDLDAAVGNQLDMLGAIVQAPRTVPFQPSNGVSPILDDATYRILIKATIGKNQWNGTIDGLYPIWQSLFPGGKIVVADNQNMTATILMSGSFTSITKDLITNGMIVPRPQGVLYTYSFATEPVFGADLSNAYVAGADLGHAA